MRSQEKEHQNALNISIQVLEESKYIWGESRHIWDILLSYCMAFFTFLIVVHFYLLFLGSFRSDLCQRL